MSPNSDPTIAEVTEITLERGSDNAHAVFL